MTTFVEQVNSLLAVTEEWTDDRELIEATGRLADLAVEADDIGDRFTAAMVEVQSILHQRLGRA